MVFSSTDFSLWVFFDITQAVQRAPIKGCNEFAALSPHTRQDQMEPHNLPRTSLRVKCLCYHRFPLAFRRPNCEHFLEASAAVLAHHLARYYAAAWITIGIVWLVGAFATKPVERIQTRTSRPAHTLVFFLAALLLLRAPLYFGVLSQRFVPRSLIVGYTGLALTIGGFAIAIWARFYLGRNWSARVTIKKDHELVRAGPYAIVRHPI